jgi:hypothetical protein
VDVCTIIAKNYVAHARVLARSFAAQHPGGGFRVLVIDDHDGYLRAEDEALEDITAEIRALTERGFAVEALSLAGLRDVERRLRELVELEVTVQSDRIDDLAPDDASVS